MQNKDKCIAIFKTFMKIGAFTFGGGYAMIPLIEEEVVKNKKWLSKEEFVDILVVAQSLPGALAINTSQEFPIWIEPDIEVPLAITCLSVSLLLNSSAIFSIQCFITSPIIYNHKNKLYI